MIPALLSPDIDQSWICYSLNDIENGTFSFIRQSKVYRCIFQSDSHLQHFNQSLHALLLLSEQLSAPILFVSEEPGSLTTQHFIFGAVYKKNILLINPLSLAKHQDFIDPLTDIQKKYGSKIYLSTTVLQPEESLNNTGPICLELMHHFSTAGSKLLYKIFNQRDMANVEQLSYYPIDLVTLQLLPNALLPLVNKALPEHSQHINSIREKQKRFMLSSSLVSPEHALMLQYSNHESSLIDTLDVKAKLKAAREALYQELNTPPYEP